MSETVQYIGKLVPIFMSDVSLEEQVRWVLEKEGIQGDADSTALETFEEELYGRYVIHNQRVYAVDRKKIDTSDDQYEAVPNDDESINFNVRYYNGGCSFNTALETAIERMLAVGIPTAEKRCRVCGAKESTHEQDHLCRVHRFKPTDPCNVCGEYACSK